MADKLTSLLDNIAGTRILVIGDIMLDHYIWGDAHRISPEAPVPVVHVDHDSYAAGGAANVALNVRALGGSCELIGTIGTDASSDTLSALLNDAGVEMEKECRSADVSTIVKTRVVVRNQQLCRLDRENAPSSYAIDRLLESLPLDEKLKNADALIVSDYAKGSITTENLERLSESCRRNDCLIAVDPKPRRQLAFKNVDLITPNRNEALEMAGIRLTHHDSFPTEEVCAAIKEKHNPARLVITLGGDGMLLCENGGSKQIPTFAQEVFDVSGAGDTVIAAMTSALGAGADLETAADFANHAAGVVVAKLGTAIATPEEVIEHSLQTGDA